MAPQAPNLLPPNATTLEKAIMAAVLKQYGKLPISAKRKLWNPDTCPMPLLPWLAWTFGLESWSNDWSEAVKRARVRGAIPVAKRRGTIGSMRRLLESYGGNMTIKEWWQYTPPREPHTFDITVVLNGKDGQSATAQFVQEVIDDIHRTKPVRSHFKFTQGLQVNGELKVAGCVRLIQFARIKMLGS